MAVGAVAWLLAQFDAFKVKDLLKLQLLVRLDKVSDVGVEVVSPQLDLQNRRHVLESDEFHGVLLPVLRRLVLVLALEPLLGNVLPDAVLDGLIPFHVELNRQKLLFPS